MFYIKELHRIRWKEGMDDRWRVGDKKPGNNLRKWREHCWALLTEHLSTEQWLLSSWALLTELLSSWALNRSSSGFNLQSVLITHFSGDCYWAKPSDLSKATSPQLLCQPLLWKCWIKQIVMLRSPTTLQSLLSLNGNSMATLYLYLYL